MTNSADTSTAQRFGERAADFTGILERVDGRWDAATPCEGWSVRDVVGHVIQTERDFLSGQDLPTGAEPDLADPLAAWRSHAAHLAGVLARDGVAETEYDGFFGRTTIGATMADFYGWDLVIHGSDVARASGQEWNISAEEAEWLHRTADGWGDALYGDGICAGPVEVGDDASVTDRLLARLGRDPEWAPA